jgi:hypothetical protein
MTDLRARMRALDQLRAPDYWSEVELRASAAPDATRPDRGPRRTRLLVAALLAILAVSTAVAVGSGLIKLPVILPAPSPSAAADLCVYGRDTALDGKTIYAIAYTNADGAAGYSAAGCDVFTLALIENSGDTSAGAGDLVLYGRRPTAFDAPYDFVALSLPPADVTALLCYAGTVKSFSESPPFFAWYDLPGADPVNLEELNVTIDTTVLFLQDWREPVGSDTQSSDSIPEAQRVDPADNAFLDVKLFTESNQPDPANTGCAYAP